MVFWLILLSKIRLFLNVSEHNFFYPKIVKSVFIFSLASGVGELLAFCELSINKSFKIYPGSMLYPRVCTIKLYTVGS
jgi:hypothetical protein